MEKLLTQDYLKKLITYNEKTGIFTWKERSVETFTPGKRQLNACNIWNSRFSGKVAENVWTSEKCKVSYIRIRITIDGKNNRYLAHRLAILYTEGRFPAEQVDHIDGNGLNNRRDNLREVTHGENMKNLSMYSTNSSGTVGVYWDERCQKWRVLICVNKKRIHGGLFTDKADAIQKRKVMEIEYGYHNNHGRKTES